MTALIRYGLFFISGAQFLVAIAFFVQLPFVVNLWPFPGTTPLTFIFVSSILAAAAASTLWVAAKEQYAALAGIGLDYVAILAPLSIFCFQRSAGGGGAALMASGALCVVGSLFGLGVLAWSIRIPADHTLPMPRFVRWSFGIFVLLLVIVSIQLLIAVPNVIPWTITPDLSVVIGWMFLGAAVYFVYALLQPSWANAAGQLAGFLAYDVVLIIPFLTRLPIVAPEQRMSLIIYTAVVSYSGVLAIYYLFIHQPTRVWASMPATSSRKLVDSE